MMNNLAAALAALPDRRDFAFSTDLGRAAWIDGDTIEWIDDTPTHGPGSGPVRRTTPGVPLPDGTVVELVDRRRIGLCRPIDAGVELLVIDVEATGHPVHKIAALATPRTCLLPRRPGAPWQLLAVTGFEEVTALLRIDWVEGTWTEVGRLPTRVDGGVWLGSDRRLALNGLGPSGRASVYAVDLDAGQFSPLFELSPDSDDRVVLFDAETGHLVVTTDAPGWPAVGVGRLASPGEGAGIRFLPALPEGDEGARPCGFVGPPETRRLLLHHETGSVVRLRTADLATFQISDPLPVPDGEVDRVVAVDGPVLRFAFSAPDRPWAPARLDLDSGQFRFDLESDQAVSLRPGRVTTFPGPAGPMPAVCLEPVVRVEPAMPSEVVVVALHGGPIARWGTEFRAELQLFAHLGARVVALDYPGSTGWGRPYMNSLLGAAGSIDVEAVASVIDGLGASTVLLYGESYGAFLALAVAAVRPVAGVMAFAPFNSFESLKAHGPPEVRETLELLDGGNSYETGRNPFKGCRTIRSKVLIAHGTADLTIPVGESRALAQALRDGRDAGDDGVRLVELDGQGHDLVGRHVLERWFRELAEFTDGFSRTRSPAQREHQAAGALSRRPRETTPGKEVDPHVRTHQG